MTESRPVIPGSFHGWILATIAAGEPPQVWQLQRIFGAGLLAGARCEGCGADPEEPDAVALSFYRCLSISDPDGMDPQTEYCSTCLVGILGMVNNHLPVVQGDFLSYMYKPRVPSSHPQDRRTRPRD